MNAMKITSPSFKHNGAIPEQFTCDGADINPALVFEGVPTEAKSLALIVDDPDAPRGIWVHWVVWNIGPGMREIKKDSVPAGSKQGMNDFRRQDYGGPCPPSGTHRYYFKLYALDKALDLAPNTNKTDLESAMQGHIIGQAELIGFYKRK